MEALVIIAALAAQATTQSGSAAPSSTVDSADRRQAGATTYVDLEGGLGYSTNPQLSVVDDRGSAFGRVSVHAVHSRVSERSTTLLSGFAENTSYFTNHGSQQSVNLYGRHETAINEHTRLFGDVNATYQENGSLDTRVLGIPFVPPPPGGSVTPPILIPPSGDFLSVTGRTYSIGGHVGGSFALSPRDSMTLTSGAEHTVFRSGAIRTAYTSIPASLEYSRTLTERTKVGARLLVQDTEYDGPANFRVITPQLTMSTLLAPRISLNGAAGVSFARSDDGHVVRHSTGVTGNVSVCGEGEANYICATVAADQEAATTAGPARSFSANVDYSQRLDANQSIQFSLGATHYSTPISVLSGLPFSSSTYLHAAASYSRRISTRLFGGVNVAARKLTRNGPDAKTDLNASLFIRYRFGDVQ